MDANLKRIEKYQKDINMYFVNGLTHTDDEEVVLNLIRILAYHVMVHRAALTEKSLSVAQKYLRRHDVVDSHTPQLLLGLLLAIDYVNYSNVVSSQVRASWKVLTEFDNPYMEAFFRLTVEDVMPRHTSNPWQPAMKAMPPFRVSEELTREQLELLVLNFLMTSRLGEKWVRLRSKSWFATQLEAFREVWDVLPLHESNAVPLIFTTYFLKHLDDRFELSRETVTRIHEIALMGLDRYNNASDSWRKAEVGLRQMMLYDVEIGWQGGH